MFQYWIMLLSNLNRNQRNIKTKAVVKLIQLTRFRNDFFTSLISITFKRLSLRYRLNPFFIEPPKTRKNRDFEIDFKNERSIFELTESIPIANEMTLILLMLVIGSLFCRY